MRVVGLIFDEHILPPAPENAAAPASEAPAAGAGAADTAGAPEKALEDMTVAELRRYAVEHGIDVTGAAKKQDLLLAIRTAMEPSAGPEKLPEPAEA